MYHNTLRQPLWNTRERKERGGFMPFLKEALNWNSTLICRVSLDNRNSVLRVQQTRITEVLTHSSMYRVHIGGYGSPRLPIFFIAMNVLGTYIVVVSRCLLYVDCLETPSLISWSLDLSSALWYILFCSTKLLTIFLVSYVGGACLITDHPTKEENKINCKF